MGSVAHPLLPQACVGGASRRLAKIRGKTAPLETWPREVHGRPAWWMMHRAICLSLDPGGARDLNGARM